MKEMVAEGVRMGALLATACRSEEVVDDWWYLFGWLCFIAGTLLGTSALVANLLPKFRAKLACWSSICEVLPMTFLLGFAYVLYRLDFTTGGDGEPASPPLLKALWQPLLLWGGCVFLAVLSVVRASIKIEGNKRLTARKFFQRRDGQHGASATGCR